MPTVYPAVLGNPDGSGGVYLPIREKLVAGNDTVKAIYSLRVGLSGMTGNQNPKIETVNQVMSGAGMPVDGGSGSTDLLTPLDPMTPLLVRSGDKLHLRAVFAIDSTESYMAPSNSDMGGTATSPSGSTPPGTRRSPFRHSYQPLQAR